MIKVAGTFNLKWLMCSAGVLALASPAIAQTTESSAQPQGQSDAAPAMAGTAGAQQPGNGYSSDIIVTAQRRSERLIDTPQSVSALTAEDLSRLNAVKLVDYANTVPGLQIVSQGVGRTQINLRGVSTGTDVSSTVGVYVDDVPYGSSTIFALGQQLSLDAGLFDLDRVEVLRGPQGTLYGASSVGGLIKYVTHSPSLVDFEGMARAGISTTRHGGTSYNGNAVVNAPIVTDKVAIRVSGFYSRDGGYVDNVQTGEKNVDRAKVYGARADLLLQPVDDLSIRLTAYGQNIRRDGGLYADYDQASHTPVLGALDQSHPLQEPFSQNYRMASGTINYTLGDTTLTSITSYQDTKSRTALDISRLYVPLLSLFGIPAAGARSDGLVTTKKFAQEVRLSSKIGDAVEIIAGGFYTHEKSEVVNTLPVFDANLNELPFNLFTGDIPTVYKEYAVFGDITWHLSDKFDVTGGARYAHNRQRYEQIASGLLGVSQPVAKSQQGVMTYLANARYHFSKNVMAYARFATGYRPGGPNTAARDAVTGLVAFPTPLKSDTLDSYEAGLKAETADRTFGIDLSGYYINWKDIQIGTSVNAIAGYVNAGGAHIEGAEVAFTARPAAELSVVGSFAYNHSSLTEANASLGATKGERLPNTAPFTGTVTADYVLASSNLKPSFGATLRYVGKRNSGFSQGFLVGFPNYKIPDYVSVDLRAGLVFGPVEAQAFVRNIFDERGQLSATTIVSGGPTGPASVAIMQPRTIGISLTTRF